MRVVIIGGGTTGSSLAIELRKLNKEIEIVVLEKSNLKLKYCPCALPYVLSGEIESFEKIFLIDENFYRENNIDFRNNIDVVDIDRNKKEVKFLEEGEEKKLNYDKLVICVGGIPSIPKIKNLENIKYFTFTNIDDAKKLDSEIEKGRKAIVIGGGAIGVELAHSLRERGMEVTIIEAEDRLVPASLDRDMAKILEDYLEGEGIKVQKSCYIEEVRDKELRFNTQKEKFDLLIVCCGFRANLDLAKKARINCDKGILVDDYMKTSDENIFSCGDCVEVKHFLTGKNTLSQLGSTALRQVRVLARNILGKKVKFVPVLNNNLSKIGELYFGSTGINTEFAERLGLKIVSGKYKTRTTPKYYPKGKEITIKLICDFDGKILGAQMVGYENFADKLNFITFCIKKGLNLDELINGEYCYNPCASNPINELSIVAEICKRKLESEDVT